MRINKTRNATRNVFFGVVEKTYSLLVPFVFRTIMIRTIGVQYLGLNSLFSSVLQVLNLAELGVGSAMVFSMYKPIAEDDTDHICALMRLYRLYYRVIGLVILCIGLLCLPFIPKLIHGQIPPDMNVHILYLLNLSVTVLSYWLFAYRSCVINAYQRRDIISKIHIAAGTFKYALQLIALICLRNYYYYVVARILTQIFSNIIVLYITRRFYPQYQPIGKLTKDEIHRINRRVRDLFTSKVGGVIIHSADTIVISSFLGLEILAIYQNYYYVISAIMAFVTIFNTSVLAGVGNSLVINSEEENYKEFRVFSFMQYWIIGFCFCCFISLFQPFMTIWMGAHMLLDFPIIVLMSFVFIGDKLVQMMSVYKDAGGIWHEDRYRPILSGVCNLVVNIIMVQIWGIYGVVISTILSVFCISLPWITNNIFKYLFANQNKIEYIKYSCKWFCLIVFSGVVCYCTCKYIIGSTMLQLMVRMIICIIIPNLLFFFAFNKTSEFDKVKALIKKVLRGNE